MCQTPAPSPWAWEPQPQLWLSTAGLAMDTCQAGPAWTSECHPCTGKGFLPSRMVLRGGSAVPTPLWWSCLQDGLCLPFLLATAESCLCVQPWAEQTLRSPAPVSSARAVCGVLSVLTRNKEIPVVCRNGKILTV